MKVFLAAVLFVGLCVALMAISMILKPRTGRFPDYDIGSNEQMRRRGIKCFREEDEKYHRRGTCNGNLSDACKDCNYYRK